jgi:hypothetical protein
MENQHEKIKGCRDLTQDEFDLINKIRQKGEELGALIEERWISIGQTDLQKGIMALVRAVAKPESF